MSEGEKMGQEERIQNAYRGLGGKRTFYDGMITCSTLSGWAVCRLVWGMGRAETQDYLCAAFWGRQFRHRTLTQRLSCVPGQGGCLAGDLSCTAARRDLLRLLLCAGTKPPHGLANPQAVCAKGLVHPAL